MSTPRYGRSRLMSVSSAPETFMLGGYNRQWLQRTTISMQKVRSEEKFVRHVRHLQN